MTNYKCEESCLCLNFQSAICLHCNRRLCLQHLTEHNKIVSGNIENLSNKFKIVCQDLKQDIENNRIIYNNTLTSLTQWRTEQLAKIEQIYEKQLQSIKLQQENLQNSYKDLLNKLENDAQQPFRLLDSQPSGIISILNIVENKIKDFKKDRQDMNSIFPKLPIMNITKDDYESRKKRKRDSSPINTVNVNFCRSLPRFIDMFKYISSIEEFKVKINIYIRNQRTSFELSNLVCSYLSVWHKRHNFNTKDVFLTKYISTIREYLPKRKSDFDIIIGIEGFFYDLFMNEHRYTFESIFKKNKNNQTPAREIMIFLLKFFLNHQLINSTIILNWYNDKTMISYEGFEFVKDLATPFIKSISIARTVDNTQPITTGIKPTEQKTSITIKDEPVLPNRIITK
ncbi:unnamed protein product [Adineta steineri]|uniref:Uncharacterized protein n=1 Tax=Adineta steineri TaxID=433720 RepID=A0A819ZQ87_9BILA|nr:unnamed protein product [Adineta steineri]CAF4173407.1 unnamed protein product [Adineta steineri]